MKRIFFVLFFCGSTIVISGCWDRIEVNDLAIVTAAGFDMKDEHNVEVFLQVYLPKSAGSSGSSGGNTSEGNQDGKLATMVRSQVGTNISDALSKLQGKVPREIFWGQCKVFILGESLSEKGLHDSLDFMLRHPKLRERAYVYVNAGSPKTILEASPTLERYSGEVLRALTDLHVGMRITMNDLNEMLRSTGKAAIMPYIKILQQKTEDSKDQKIHYFAGTAVFKKDKMIGIITEKETRGLLWLRNEIETYTVTVRPEGQRGQVSLNPVSAKVKLIPQIHNDVWKMIVKIDTEGSVLQNGTKLNILEPSSLDLIEKAYREDIINRVQMTIEQAQHKLKLDIIKFGEQFHRKYPKQWKQIEHRWDEVFPEVEVQLDVKARIRRQGYIRKLEVGY